MQDETGEIKVDLNNADLDAQYTTNIQQGNLRYYEIVIKEGDYLQILGNVVELESNAIEPELIVKNEKMLYASTQKNERKIPSN